MSKKEISRNMRIRGGFDDFFCLRSNLSNETTGMDF